MLTTELKAFHEIATQLTAPEIAVKEVSSALSHLLRQHAFLERHVLSTIDPIRGKDPYVATTFEGPDSSYSLQVFVWPAGSSTQIHDHSCWGAFAPATGPLVEERYARLDNGSQPNQAHLKKAWQRAWQKGAGISTLLPYDGGIHRVSNPGPNPVISFNIYGPFGRIDGRDYDPLYDYVCDRLLGT
jgi:predicted metal-dependent enzyme (double-stranded beta helix superfamily)